MVDKKVNAQKEFCWPIRVYVEDTDVGGIVYYVNYLKFMERARTEFLRSLGFGKDYIFGCGSMFVVHSAAVRYVKPAVLDDELVVKNDLLKSARSYFLIQQDVYRGDELVCTGEIKIACVTGKQLKPVAMPKKMYAALQAL